MFDLTATTSEAGLAVGNGRQFKLALLLLEPISLSRFAMTPP